MHPRFKSVPDVSYHVNILWLLVEFYHKRVRGGRWCYSHSVGDCSSGLWGHVGPSPGVFFGATKPGVFHGCQVFTQRGTKRNTKKHAGDETKKKYCTYWGNWVAGFGKKLCLDRGRVQSRVFMCQLTWCLQVH